MTESEKGIVMDYHLFDPSTEVAIAERIADGGRVPTSDGLPPLILSREEYFDRDGASCTHPQGYPCFTTCVPQVVNP